MQRKLERNLLRFSASWDICIGLITMFAYYPWFEEQGITAFQQVGRYDYLNSSLVGMISKVVMIVALATILIGIISWINAASMKNNKIEKRIIYWLLACVVIHLLIYDVIGIILYLVTFVIYNSRNKALKMLKAKNSYS
ncbi:hypothetical protein [Enterococcus mediterraneensis]|uniref:hypothetical protein n=1 Tax=Enterococcus mediterraneensis TaxID=2364791 RepID=UPI000F05746C|nr:hypothetical protein [Enterococcus mediterraneensis]